ncbi:MAG: hypothetical protein ABJC74_16350 [Gemmatimonadota bacterium]
MLTRRLLPALMVGAFAVVGYLRNSNPQGPQSGQPVPVPSATTPVTSQSNTAPAHPEVGFRDAEHLEEHFHKHGAEFQAATAMDYLRLAQQLRDGPAGGDILEAIRHDGTITRFDRRSGAFLAVDGHGMILTFFRPNDGEAYFRRQLNREPSHS